MDGGDRPAVILWFDEIGDTTYILTENIVAISLDTRSRQEYEHNLSKGVKSHFPLGLQLNKLVLISTPRD